MHDETIMLGIQWLCIAPNIKLNQKSRYVCIHIWPLSYVYLDFSIQPNNNGLNHQGNMVRIVDLVNEISLDRFILGYHDLTWHQLIELFPCNPTFPHIFI